MHPYLLLIGLIRDERAMAARAATLDLSALSPAEWSSYEQWLALVDNAGKLSPERMLALVARAVGPLVYNRAREEEVRAALCPPSCSSSAHTRTDTRLLRSETASGTLVQLRGDLS